METIATKIIPEIDKQGNNTDHGEVPITDVAKDKNTTPTVVSESSSVPMDQPEIERHQSQKIEHDPQKVEEESISPLDWKRRGTEYFGREDWNQALHAYQSGLAAFLLEQNEAAPKEGLHDENVTDAPSTTTIPASDSPSKSSLPTVSTADPLEVALRSNITFVLLKLQEYNRAEEECNKLLQISPLNSKALFRRACAREGLYFSNNNNNNNSKQIESATSTKDVSKCKNTIFGSRDCIEREKELLRKAINDLERALFNLEKEHHNEEHRRQSASDSGKSIANDKNGTNKNNQAGLQKQCRKSLDRLQREYNRQEKQQWKNDVTIAELPKSTNTSSNQELRSQQRQDVLRLLLARYQNGRILRGEAYFLLEWNWWVRWCRYVNFFDTSSSSTRRESHVNTNINRMSERTQHMLHYFPAGATLPTCFRKDPNDDEGDDSSDEEEDDDNTALIAPGHIDNTELFVRSGDIFFREWYLPFPSRGNVTETNNIDKKDFVSSQLKPHLIRGYHYEILPREVYNALRSWYGEVTPSICRRISADGKLMIYPSRSSRLIISYQEFQRCNACRAPGAIWRCKQCMMVQYCDKTCQESHWSFHLPYCRSRQSEKHNKSTKSISLARIPLTLEGNRVGLNNLGNTCFMNSALQSLSHATPLTRHFLSSRFRSDLNVSNPLGTGGKLAIAYEAFLKDVWMKPGITSTSPTALKRAIALFAPRFAGYQQHDAQEFLAYLLDGLHEDLNRIRQAPYVEMPDVTDGQNMTIAGAEAWGAHKRRNDSLVMDTFYGQFQSTCVCPKCNRVSVSFDTFNHVSLEIPSNRSAFPTVSIPVLVHFADGKRKPVRYGVTVRQKGCVLDLKNALANLSHIIANNLILTDVYESTVYKLLDDKQNLATINLNEDTIVAYEVTPYTTKDTLHMIVTHSLVAEASFKSENEDDKNMSGESEVPILENEIKANDSERKSIGLPFMTSIDAKNGTCHDLWELMCSFVRRIVKNVVDDGDERKMEGILSDPMDESENYRLEDILTVHVVDAQGRPRDICEENESHKATSLLPNHSQKLLSTILGEDCAENFLFLTLVWNFQTICTENPKIIINSERFLDFENHPTLVEGMAEQQPTNFSSAEQGVTLHQCFRSFSRPERLDTENMWYCSSCKEHVQALKTMKLWRLPNILVIHLKRFEFKHAFRRDKLGTFVDFPLTGLDMNPHCASLKSTEDFVANNVPADYDLFAVVNHYGRLGFGHYTAFAMQWDETGISGAWNAFDDSSVRPIQSSEIQSSAAYILFYRRRVFH